VEERKEGRKMEGENEFTLPEQGEVASH
jgi:hypothetical protein